MGRCCCGCACCWDCCVCGQLGPSRCQRLHLPTTDAPSPLHPPFTPPPAPAPAPVAVVTCGGLCPGLNDVVQGLVSKLTDYGVPEGNIIGIKCVWCCVCVMWCRVVSCRVLLPVLPLM